jgi:glycerol-1-phosphate dehydrogenase [NAD(P)+]
VGALFASYLRGDELTPTIEACMARHGVPRLPAEIGLSAEQFAEAVAVAPTTRPRRFTVLEHLAMDPEEIRKRVDAFLETYDR